MSYKNVEYKERKDRKMNKYESVIIIKPDLMEEKVEEIIEKIKELMISFTDKNKDDLKIENLGKRKLAYSIKNYSEGIYIIFTFNANSENISELERVYRIKKEEVMKFIVVRKDDDYE